MSDNFAVRQQGACYIAARHPASPLSLATHGGSIHWGQPISPYHPVWDKSARSDGTFSRTTPFSITSATSMSVRVAQSWPLPATSTRITLHGFGRHTALGVGHRTARKRSCAPVLIRFSDCPNSQKRQFSVALRCNICCNAPRLGSKA